MDAIPVTFHLTDDEKTYLEACLIRRRELLALCDAAPSGHVLAQCENAAVEIARQHGRALVRDALARRVASAEKKRHRPAPVPAVGTGKAGVGTRARS